MIDRFITWLKAQVGSIYVWGGQGEIAFNEDWIRKMETSDKNANRAIALFRKRKSENKDPIAAYDCSGLIVCFLICNDIIQSDMTASGLYSICTPTKRENLKAGNLIFRHNGTKIHHVGVYIGNDMVIHAKGRDAGVVMEHIDVNGSDYWNRFGEYEELTERTAAKMKVLKIVSPLMRGNDVEKLQVALNGLGYDCGEPDGVCGKQTMAGIESFCKAHASKIESEPKAAVTVKIGDKTYGGEVTKNE